MSNAQRFITNQKVGENQPLNQAFIKKLRNFVNNFTVEGGTFKFDGYKAVLRIGQTRGGSQVLPWRVTSNGAAVKVNVGTIGGIVPSNIFSELTIAGTGTEYVIVTATMTSNAPTSALLSIQTTAPTPSLTNESAPPAEVHDVLAVLLDGQIFQVRAWNLNVESQLVFEAPVTEPQIGEPNTTPWYRWAVSEGW